MGAKIFKSSAWSSLSYLSNVSKPSAFDVVAIAIVAVDSVCGGGSGIEHRVLHMPGRPYTTKLHSLTL